VDILPYQPVRIQHLPWPEAVERGISVSVLREDENHPHASGNKWWKLRLNLKEAVNGGYRGLLTFGGAYSNHIFATAAAAHGAGLLSVGIIRGEPVANATLQFAESCGMQLRFVSREQYRKKAEPAVLASLVSEFESFYVLPEGGTNTLAVQSCTDWGKQLWEMARPDVAFLPVGTGGTLAGLICGFAGRGHLAGISVLKGGDFLTEDVARLVHENSGQSFTNWSVETAYHGGGYGKASRELHELITEMEARYALPLDPVYTGKLVWAVRDMIQKNKLRAGTRLLLIHTGGLQGRQAR